MNTDDINKQIFLSGRDGSYAIRDLKRSAKEISLAVKMIALHFDYSDKCTMSDLAELVKAYKNFHGSMYRFVFCLANAEGNEAQDYFLSKTAIDGVVPGGIPQFVDTDSSDFPEMKFDNDTN